ncbi:MAG: DEAD/DEAH box helicase [Pseudomonadota bacterium]
MQTQSKIAAPLAQALADKGYETLTPVQEAVLDPDLETRDLLVSAQTGSGKTVAFGLALASSVLGGSQSLPKAGAPLALIIAPTRELALQVTKELEWLYGAAEGKIASCIGGMDYRDERRALDQGVHIVVGTPGRLVDHIRRGSLDMDLLRAVVLDEADEMLNMGFREELEMILDDAPLDRRTLMFSATVSKPIARLAENYQTDAARVNTLAAKSSHIDIEYQALTVMPTDVEKAIINLLLFHDAPNAIVFCARREGVNKLTSRLTNRGFDVVALSGEFTQKERTNSIAAMRDGRARVCVATDVAARGLDLPGLDLVIHADLPRNKEGLLHRSGRTGRAGRKGVCALIVPVRAKRRTERLLQDSGVEATWATPPSSSDIELALNQRLLASDLFAAPIAAGERDLTKALLDAFSPEQLASAIVRLTRAQDSAPEMLQDVSAARERPEKRPRSERGDRDRSDEGRPRGPRKADFADGHWIKLGVGRKNKADPKWLIPMLCKSGGFSRNEIGSIQINPGFTLVELKPGAAESLMNAAGEAQVIDNSIWVDRAPAPEVEADAAPYRPEKRKRNARPKVRRTPDSKPGKPKPKKPRTGPKKPRGPNGEKRRSPKKAKA